MPQKLKTALLIVLPALITFPLGRIIWPDPVNSMMHPTSAQLPFFIILSAAESLAFGVGIWFLVEGKKVLASLGQSRLALWAYLAIAWTLVSWWPHDNLHRINGENMQGLLYIEYGFHLTLMISSTIIALFFLQVHKNRQTN